MGPVRPQGLALSRGIRLDFLKTSVIAGRGGGFRGQAADAFYQSILPFDCERKRSRPSRAYLIQQAAALPRTDASLVVICPKCADHVQLPGGDWIAWPLNWGLLPGRGRLFPVTP